MLLLHHSYMLKIQKMSLSWEGDTALPHIPSARAQKCPRTMAQFKIQKISRPAGLWVWPWHLWRIRLMDTDTEIDCLTSSVICCCIELERERLIQRPRSIADCLYAAVNGNLDPTLSKGRQAFGVNSTSHLHLQKIEVGWIFTLFIFGRSESAPYLSVGYGESLPNHANCITYKAMCESSPKNILEDLLKVLIKK